MASIAIAGVLTATAANILVPMFLQTELNAAYEELYMITTAVREVKEYEGELRQPGQLYLSHHQRLYPDGK